MGIVEEIESFIRPVLAENQFELLETQYRKESGRWVLRIFIDKFETMGTLKTEQMKEHKSAVTLADCEKVSNMVGVLLDASELVGNGYVLEVSSPGINRALKKESHFQRHLGEKVKVALFAPLSDQTKQKNFSGVLVECKSDAIEVEDIVSGKVRIPLSAIAKAHLDLI